MGCHPEAHAAWSDVGADVPSLTLRWTPGLGHICHVRGRDASSSRALPDTVRTVSSRKTTRSFHQPEWSSLGRRIDQAKLQIRAEEDQVFRSLRDEVSGLSSRRTSRCSWN